MIVKAEGEESVLDNKMNESVGFKTNTTFT